MKLPVVLLSLLIHLGTFQADAFSLLCACPVNVAEVPQSSWLSLAASPDGATLELMLTNGAVIISTNSGAVWTVKAPTVVASNTVAPPVDPSLGTGVAPAARSAAVEATQPVLDIGASAEGVVLSWPLAFVRFRVEQSLDSWQPTWETITNAVIATNGQNRVTIRPSNGSAFFRVSSP
jgi:hypothetical protein